MFGVGTLLFAGLLLFSVGIAKTEAMVATWYGPGFEGATTASGEPFNPDDYTAAHRTLAFGTKLIVTYQGQSVVVRINDRGPYSDADLDLSQAAAEYIGLTAAGQATVDVVTADPSTPTGPYSASSTGDSSGSSSGGSETGGETTSQQSAPESTLDGSSDEADQPQQNGNEGNEASAELQALVNQAESGSDQYDQYGRSGNEANIEEFEAASAPATPAAAPTRTMSDSPETDKALPGSTAERRGQLAGGQQTAEPRTATQGEAADQPVKTEAQTAVKPAANPATLLTRLPDTGGQLLVLPLGILLMAVGSLLHWMSRR